MGLFYSKYYEDEEECNSENVTDNIHNVNTEEENEENIFLDKKIDEKKRRKNTKNKIIKSKDKKSRKYRKTIN